MVRPPTAAATTGVPGRLGLGGDQAEGLVVGGDGDCRGRGVPLREHRLRDRWDEAHDVGDAEVGGQVGQRLRLVEAGSGRPPDDGYDERRAPAGLALQQLGDGVEQDVGGLQRLDASGEQQHVGVDGEPQPGPGLDLGHRDEDVQVDTGVDHLDPAGVGVVELDELLGLDVGVGDQHVCGLDDLLLTDDPGQWLGGVACGERGVLDLRHRVHAVHERHSPAVPGERADLAGQPVVRVDRVVVADRLGGLGAQHLAREDAQLGGQLLLGEPLERTRVDVPDRDPVRWGRPRARARSWWRG